MTRTRIVGLAVAGALVALVGWAAFAVLGRAGDPTRSQLVGGAAPALVLPDAETGELLGVGAPGKVLVINFWAPWCVPCLPEHRLLNRAATTFDPDDVLFVGITYQSDPGDVAAFLDRVGRSVRSFADGDGRASIEFGVTGVPETFFVDRTGVVRERIAGPLTESELYEIVERLAAPAGQ